MIALKSGDDGVFADERLTVDSEVMAKSKNVVRAQGEIQIAAAPVETGDRWITLERELTLFRKPGQAVQK